MTKKYWAVEAREANLEHSDSLLFQHAAGERIEAMLRDTGSPLVRMMAKAREGFLAGTHSLLHADLHTTEGIQQAIRQQAEARRYLELAIFIADEIGDAEVQESSPDEVEEEEAAVEELKDTIYGPGRAKPADDAQ